MFSNIYSENPLMAQFRRMEEELDEIFGSATANIAANLKDGVLTIRIPKRAELRRRKIEVRSS